MEDLKLLVVFVKKTLQLSKKTILRNLSDIFTEFRRSKLRRDTWRKSVKSRHHVTGRELEMEEEGGRLEKDNYICVKNSVIQSFQCIKNVPFLKESKRANMYRIIDMYP